MKSATEMELEITQHQVAELTKERDELRRKLSAMEAELIFQTRCDPSEVELVYRFVEGRSPAPVSIVNRRMGDAHRKRFAVEDQRDALAAALKPFAEFYEGDLAEVGGGTQIQPTMLVRFFKDAKAAMKMVESEVSK